MADAGGRFLKQDSPGDKQGQESKHQGCEYRRQNRQF